MKKYYEIYFQVLDLGVPREMERMVWQSNLAEPRNEIKDHLKKIKYGDSYEGGVGKEIIILKLTQITENDYNLINKQIVAGQ